IGALSLRFGVNRSAVALTAFLLVLRSYTREDDLCVGMPVGGRADARFADAIGYFVNMVALRCKLDMTVTFGQLLHQVQATMLDAVDHAAYPIQRLVRALNITPSRSHAPLFQVCFAYQNIFGERRAKEIEFVDGVHQEGGYELELEVLETGADLQLNWKFNA